MKLDDVHLAGNLARAREQLLHLRDRCKLSAHLSTGGTHDTIDPPLIAKLEPIVKAELTRRIELVDQDLAAIGVDVGGSAVLARG